MAEMGRIGSAAVSAQLCQGSLPGRYVDWWRSIEDVSPQPSCAGFGIRKRKVE